MDLMVAKLPPLLSECFEALRLSVDRLLLRSGDPNSLDWPRLVLGLNPQLQLVSWHSQLETSRFVEAIGLDMAELV